MSTNRGGPYSWWEPGNTAKDEGGSTPKTVKFGDRVLLKDTTAGKYLEPVSSTLPAFTPTASLASSGTTFVLDDYASPGVRNHAIPADMNSQMLILTTANSQDPNGYLGIAIDKAWPQMLGSTTDASYMTSRNRWYMEKANYDYTTPLTYGDTIRLYYLKNGTPVQYLCTKPPCTSGNAASTSAYMVKNPATDRVVEFQVLNADGIVPKMPATTKAWATVTPVKSTDWKLFLSIGVVAIVLLLGGFGIYKYYKQRS